MTDLLDAVDALTKSTVEHYSQNDETGRYEKTHTTNYPPLLDRLRAAINPSTNTASGSSSLASTRNLIDSDALFRYSTICAQIGDWCRLVNVTRSKDPVVDLRRWYIAYNLVDSGTGWYASELRKWARAIADLLEPPKRLEVTAPCPVCKSATWVDHEGVTLPHPVQVQYRMPKDGEPISPKATCRNAECGAVWDSYAAIEELGDELNGRHAEEIMTPL